MIFRSLSLSIALAAALAGPVLAAQPIATLGPVKGDVRLAAGSGLASAGSGAALKAGDRIVARGGSTSIRYADGCVVTASAGTMITIGQASPCAGGQGLVTPGSAAALSLPDFGKLEPGAYVAGFGVVLLGAGLIAAITTKSDSVSP